jgi:acyl-coenzyme A thioesterase PaaI-like protein
MALLTVAPTKPGVSVEMSTSFTSAAKEGDIVTVEGRYAHASLHALLPSFVRSFLVVVCIDYCDNQSPIAVVWLRRCCSHQSFTAIVGDDRSRRLCGVRVLKSGARLGFTQVDLFRKSDGNLVASGRHTKAL